MLTFCFRYLSNLREIERIVAPDVVIEGAAYTLPFLPSARLARRCGAQLVYEVRDIWPLSLYELGISRWNPITWIINKAQSFALRSADITISSLRFADIYFSETGRDPNAFAYISNAADLTLFEMRDPMPETAARQIAKLKSRCTGIVGYAGSIGHANSVDRLLEAAHNLEDKGVGVIIIGEGAKKDELIDHVAARKQGNVVFLDSVPKAQVFDIIDEFDLGFVGGRIRKVHQYGVSPNKLYDYMICAVPVLFCLSTDDNIVAEANCGISVTAPTVATIQDGITEFFLLDAAQRTAMGERGRQAVKARYTYAMLAQNYEDALSNLRQDDPHDKIA